MHKLWTLALMLVGLTFVFLAPTAPAAAEGLSGRALAEGCQENTLERITCLGYMEGFSDGFASNDKIMTTFLRENVRSGHLAVSAEAQRVEKPAYCVDDEIPAEVVRKVYLDWAAAHPDELDQPAASALFLSLAEAFPCSGEPAVATSYQAVSWQPSPFR